jgi:hypothetical protein
MISAIAIATGLLAVLDDDDAPVDFEDLFQRAVTFQNPEILLDRLTEDQRAVFLDWVKRSSPLPTPCVRIPSHFTLDSDGFESEAQRISKKEFFSDEERDRWATIRSLFVHDYYDMLAKEVCSSCGSDDIHESLSFITNEGFSDHKSVAMCNECGHVEVCW